MKTLVLISFLLFSQLITYSQENKDVFLREKNKIEKKSMLALTTWAGINIVSGSIGWATTEDESKYFNQMNVAWNVVNLGIALPSLLRKHPTDLSSEEILRQQHTIEKILLLNVGLDAAYVTSGFLLREMSKNNPENYHRFRGFGNSLLVQGGFLLVFDLIQFGIHQKHRKKGFSSDTSGLTMSKNGIGLCYNF
ncbi:MAG: hypothetical protein WEA99_05640 [Brumimicrobium sp.]